MFGYNAKHIIMTMETASSPDACSINNSKMEIDGWYIDATFALDCETDRYAGGYNPQPKQGCQDKYQTKTIGNAKRGFPVYEKMTMFDESGKELTSILTEVIELSQATLDQTLFEIPADYREVKNAGEMYNASAITSAANSGSTNMPTMPNGDVSNSTVSNIQKQAQANTSNNSNEVGAKQSGVVRIGIQTKTGAVGEGINAADLAAAINNTLGEYLKGTKIELITLKAKLASLVENEAKQKECDYILVANVSHKKGGGGFGMFGKAISTAVAQTGGGSWGNTAANTVGAVALRTVVAATLSQNIKSKDEITFDIKLQKSGGAAILSQKFTAKAKSDGEDIISPMMEKMAEVILANAK